MKIVVKCEDCKAILGTWIRLGSAAKEDQDVTIHACLHGENSFGRLERKNKSLKIRLEQYEEDATELLEKFGIEPDDKVDREILKRMLNFLIGKNKNLRIENERITQLECENEELKAALTGEGYRGLD